MLFLVQKTRVKQGTMLIETMLNGDPMYFRSIIWGLYLRSRGPEGSRIRLNHALKDSDFCVHWWNGFFFQITPSDYIVVSGPKTGLFPQKGSFRNLSKIIKVSSKKCSSKLLFLKENHVQNYLIDFLCRKLTVKIYFWWIATNPK